MDKLGYDPIPTFHEPVESPGGRPDLAQDYPFVFMAGSRTKGYTHSRFREIESLRKLYPEPLIELNSGTAESLGIPHFRLMKAAIRLWCGMMKRQAIGRFTSSVGMVVHGSR